MIKEAVKNFAKGIGIEEVGFSKDAVVALFPYFVKGEGGNVSIYARGIDYHTVLEKKLGALSEYLKALGAEKVIIHVDKGLLDDRKAAFDAGLGFYGKNGMLINPVYGSYFFIGQVVHDLKIAADKPMKEDCFSCGECIKNCPGGALKENSFVLEKCLSHITQLRGHLEAEKRLAVLKNGFCWGCDVCQTVCPHNKDLETNAISEFLKDRISYLETNDIKGLSNKAFKEKFGRYAFSWRGKKPLERNLEILSSLENNNE